MENMEIPVPCAEIEIDLERVGLIARDVRDL